MTSHPTVHPTDSRMELRRESNRSVPHPSLTIPAAVCARTHRLVDASVQCGRYAGQQRGHTAAPNCEVAMPLATHVLSHGRWISALSTDRKLSVKLIKRYHPN